MLTSTETISIDTINTTTSYPFQLGFWHRTGNIVGIKMLLFFTPTFTTSSGNIRITGIPFASSGSQFQNLGNVLHNSPISYASSRTSLVSSIATGTSYIQPACNGSYQNYMFFNQTNIVSWVQSEIVLSITYNI